MELLLQKLSELTHLPYSELEPALRYFHPVTVQANTRLVSPGAISSDFWFVGSGLLRVFYFVEEKKRTFEEHTSSREITTWVAPTGVFLADIRSFLEKAPATRYIETLETSRLYSLSYQQYLKIQRSYWDIARILFEQTLVIADNRMEICNLRYPENRLEMFEKVNPGISGRLSVNVLASCLNIDPTTLSRLRAKKR